MPTPRRLHCCKCFASLQPLPCSLLQAKTEMEASLESERKSLRTAAELQAQQVGVGRRLLVVCLPLVPDFLLLSMSAYYHPSGPWVRLCSRPTSRCCCCCFLTPFPLVITQEAAMLGDESEPGSLAAMDEDTRPSPAGAGRHTKRRR